MLMTCVCLWNFAGLGVLNDISAATTVAFFREHFRKANVGFPRFCGQLLKQLS